jgi:truncated hemoglobin YjbI/glyoxylase-like metal-dependent hydrolase (beta-lactamase superfamily II)
MICETLFKKQGHVWFAFGQDPGKPDKVMDTNQIVIVSGDGTIMLDPGGMEIFPPMLAALSEKVAIKKIGHIFISHQDPDVGSSLPLWRQVCKDGVKIYLPWMWSPFVAHLDGEADFIDIPDEGMNIELAGGVRLRLIPAHYLHSAANFSVYDETARILWTGDIGAAMVPAEARKGFFVENFDDHIQYMERFHKRWMGSSAARDAWIGRVADLDIDLLVPQHGLVFKGKDVYRFLDWLANLEIGAGVAAMIGSEDGDDGKAIIRARLGEAAEGGEPGGTGASLYDRIGGEAAVDAAVDIFYQKILADDAVSNFFVGIDMDKQRTKQKAFLAMVFGGPQQYSGKGLRAVHAALVERGLDDGHFDVVAGHLGATLRELGVASDIAAEVMAIVGGARDDVLNR